MDRAATRTLARFCANQYFAFEPRAWTASGPPVEDALVAAAARYLSMTSWYGRETDLARIAELRRAGPGDDAAREHDLDLGYFACVLRMEVASRRMVRPEAQPNPS